MASLKKRIYEKVKYSPHTSFGELSRLKGFKGLWEMSFSKDENFIIYAGMSNEAVKAMNELWLKEHKIEARACDIFVYFIDGGALNIPLIKRFPKKGYKTPHWLPMTFSTPDYLKAVEGKKYKERTNYVTPKQSITVSKQ